MRMRTLIVVLVLIVLIGTVAYGWHMIRRGFSARDNPSAFEAYVARMARKLSIRRQRGTRRVLFAPSPEILSEARSHFADHCATCHGNDGIGKTEIGQNLYPKPPDMRQP